MFKNNNVNSAKCEEKKNIICLSDYYPNNCSAQEYVEVSDEVLEAYEMFHRESNKQTVSDYRHINPIGFDENIFGEMFGAFETSIDNMVIDQIWFEQLIKPYGEIVFKRATLYFIDGLSTREIAEIDNVSHTAVVKSIRLVKNIVKSTINAKKKEL